MSILNTLYNLEKNKFYIFHKKNHKENEKKFIAKLINFSEKTLFVSLYKNMDNNVEQDSENTIRSIPLEWIESIDIINIELSPYDILIEFN